MFKLCNWSAQKCFPIYFILKNIFLLGWKIVSTLFLPIPQQNRLAIIILWNTLLHQKKTKTDALKSFPIFPLRLSERAERKTNSSPRRIGKP